MPIHARITDWLETRWVAPAYSGWLLTGLSLFFFAAATNTMAGWLYIMSGLMLALLAIAAILSTRAIQGVRVTRQPIQPVSAGDPLIIELALENQTPHPKALMQVQDLLPYVLGSPNQANVEFVPPHSTYQWTYTHPTQRRGIYHWHTVQLRTAAPLGLFWCRRTQTQKVSAIVYPTVLPLKHCPLIDQVGQAVSLQLESNRRSQTATSGLTRALRPYRWGDPTRLIHWRTSARYGELRVREFEQFTGGQEFIIGLDSAIAWHPDNFEQAVIAAASLYFYAMHQHLQVQVWTAGTGLLRGKQRVLQGLAATFAGEEARTANLPNLPLVWLTQNPVSIKTLTPGSRWLLWPSQSINPQSEGSDAPKPSSSGLLLSQSTTGLSIQPEQPLQHQLQASLM
ncbi:MAG: DUF58 domain-containing protein [Cyanothece sp. SIO1E1]|nr:DUF58 domain-containing protein [Cyanothece sp. SIO1E1]